MLLQALLYAIGLGARPTPTHAAILQRLYSTSPDFFNFSEVSVWLERTGNPPLMHMPVLAGFFDGVYVLAANFKLDVNAPDRHGTTPLHASTWEGRIDMIQLLLSMGANVTGVDHNGRTLLHYAVLRGFADIITLVHQNMTQPIFARPKPNSGKTEILEVVNKPGKKRFCNLVAMKDKQGRTAMDIALLWPTSTLAAETIAAIVKSDCKRIDYLVHPVSQQTPEFVSPVSTDCRQQTCNFRGGWFYPKDAPTEPLASQAHGVDRVDGSTLDPTALYTDYIITQTPVLISNGASLSNQHIWAYWERSHFLARYGDQLLVRGEEQYYDFYDRLDISYWSHVHRVNTESQELTVAEWVARMDYRHGENSRQKDSMSCCVEEDPDFTDSVSSLQVRYNSWNSPWMAHGVNPLSRAELINRAQREEAVATLSEEKEYIKQKTGSATVNVKFDSIVEEDPSGFGPEGDDDVSVWKVDVEPISLFNDICTIHRKSSVSFADDDEPEVDPDSLCGDNVEDLPYQVFVGPVNTSIPIRAHNSSWEILVTGLKKWYLMPPGHSIYAFTNDVDERLANHSFESNLTQFILPIPEWLLRHGNKLIERGLVHEVTQYPGDIMYIPHNWAYGSVNLADSVSISQEFCTFLNTDQRFYPVGQGLYGGQDRHRHYNFPLGPLTSDLMAAINKPKDAVDTTFPQFLQ